MFYAGLIGIAGSKLYHDVAILDFNDVVPARWRELRHPKQFLCRTVTPRLKRFQPSEQVWRITANLVDFHHPWQVV